MLRGTEKGEGRETAKIRARGGRRSEGSVHIGPEISQPHCENKIGCEVKLQPKSVCNYFYFMYDDVVGVTANFLRIKGSFRFQH